MISDSYTIKVHKYILCLVELLITVDFIEKLVDMDKWGVYIE